jgi:hypothetical protein
MRSESEWQAAARAGDTVAAINLFRVATGAGLTEAKAAVERWMEENYPPSPEYLAALQICERVDARLGAYLAAAPLPISYVIEVTGNGVGLNSLYKVVTSVGATRLDLAVDVLVPGSPIKQRRQIMEGHLANGVRMSWFLDPEDISLRVGTASRPWYVYYDEYVFTGGDVLPGFSCKVSDLFG